MEQLRPKPEKQATDERLVGAIDQLMNHVPYIASGSLDSMLDNFDKLNLDKEIDDYLFVRETIDDDSVQSFKLVAECTEEGAVTLMANVRIQETNATTSDALTSTLNEFFWFTIHKKDGRHVVDTEYALRTTTDYSNNKREVIEKRHGVITEDRLMTLEIYLDLGKFDDAFDTISANLLPDENS